MQHSIIDVCIQKSKTQRNKKLSSCVPKNSSQTCPNSPQKVEDNYQRKLIRNKSCVEKHILKYKGDFHKPKQIKLVSPRKSVLQMPLWNQTERNTILQSMQRRYNLFKNINTSIHNKKTRNIKLQPISKTVQLRKCSPKKSILQNLEELKKRKLKSRTQTDIQTNQNKKLLPLRLVLSNKIRSKIVKDLVTNSQNTKINIQNILEREDQYEWLPQFHQLNQTIELKLQEAKAKRNKTLISRSNYNNAYYQFLVFEKYQKQEFIRRGQRLKASENILSKQSISTKAKTTEEQLVSRQTENCQQYSQVSFVS